MYLKEQKQSINNLLFVWEILNIKKKKHPAERSRSNWKSLEAPGLVIHY